MASNNDFSNEMLPDLLLDTTGLEVPQDFDFGQIDELLFGSGQGWSIY